MDLQEQNITLIAKPRRTLYILAGMGIVIIIFSLIGQYLRMFPNVLSAHSPLLVHNFIVGFDVNAEANFPTFYSVSMAIAASFLLFVVAYFKNKVGDRYRFHWLVLALFLLYISVDDASVIHEKVSKYLKGITDLGGWFHYRWVIVGLVIVAIFGISFFRFWLNLDNRYKILFLVSAGLFFGGAMGVEMIGGRWANANGSKNFIYILFTTLEQGMQYGGLMTLVYTLLLYIKSYIPNFSVSIKDQ